MADEIILATPTPRTETVDNDDSAAPAVGKWYKVKDGDDPRWLGCAVHVGSNYVELEGVNGEKQRVHFGEFWNECEHVPDPDVVIDGVVALHSGKIRTLMNRVREITARLAITTGPALTSGSETSALALRTDQPMDEYKAALVLAKEKSLPEIFKKIKEESHMLAQWMKAKLIPLKAQAEAMESTIGAVNDRIFSVELYAGLVETVEQVREGDPAGVSEKVRLMQRRCYMDEECLAQYETGGMEFKSLRAFDKWLSKRKNLDRILPFQKCMAAFQVRHHKKDREADGLRSFLIMIEEEKLDKLTFLYIRNGDQLFRLNTGIEFGHQLFPDMTQDQLDGKLYAKIRHGDVESLTSEGRYQEILREERELKARVKKTPKKDRWKIDRHFLESKDYHPFSQDSVYYDDILAHVREDMARHNRLVLVLQGLLDRSPVLHPHPAWHLWSHDGFKAALELIYDDSRTLAAGDKPDFEAYRARLNASIKNGTITVGQEDAWEEREAERENKRRDNDYRWKSDYKPSRFRPRGNPGPGRLAKVQWFQPKIKACTYKWNREKQNAAYGSDERVQDVITTDASKLMNVDAYKPGDFHLFFDDPRTRQEYLQWAPFLLEAEEYHAGNRKVVDPPPAPPKKEKDPEASWKYQQRKARQAMLYKAVRLKGAITTRGEKTYPKGSLWRVTSLERGMFNIQGIGPDGLEEKIADGKHRFIRCVGMHDLHVDLSIPDDPKYGKKAK